MKKKIKQKSKKIESRLRSNTVNNIFPDQGKIYIALGFILLISLLAYIPVLKNSLLDWDDNGYIKNNPLIHNINLKNIFSSNVLSNYHPVTILILAIEYHFFGLNATGYHAVNLFIHLLNIILVFQAISLFSNKPLVALVTAFLFGVHPLHVESVAWVAELKDLLYALFFFASYIFYLKYVNESKKRYYIIALLFFLVSLLSKAMAASLPVILLLTDYVKGRKFNNKILLEKIPFFFLAIVLGIVAMQAQKASGATDMAVFSVPQRLVFACYSFVSYLVNFILPINLSAFYPYPVKPGEEIPFQYYFYLPIVMGLITGVIYSIRHTKKLFFGFGFFAITIFLVLQLIPVGSAVMADRYSYIPSFGIFYLFGEGIGYLWEKNLRYLSIIILSGVVIFFSMKTYSRCSIWENDFVLWNDVIKQYQNIPVAYNNRGHIYMNEKNYDKALSDFDKAIKLKPESETFLYYYNRGSVLMAKNLFAEAIIDFNMAVKIKPDFILAIEKQGLAYFNLKKYKEAISCYSNVIKLQPNFAEAYYYRAFAIYFTGNKEAACKDLKQAADYGYKQAAEALIKNCK